MKEKVMTWTKQHWNILAIIISGVFSGGLGSFLTYQSQVSKIDYDSGKDYYTLIIEDNKRLRKENEEISTLKTEVGQLQNAVTLMESAHQDLPVPMWLKDANGKMLALNPSYEEIFLIPRGYVRKDYVGHFDEDVWPKDVANSFTANDRKVFRTGIVYNGFEMVPDAHGVLRKWQVIKYVRYSGRVKIGIGGIAIPIATN